MGDLLQTARVFSCAFCLGRGNATIDSFLPSMETSHNWRLGCGEQKEWESECDAQLHTKDGFKCVKTGSGYILKNESFSKRMIMPYLIVLYLMDNRYGSPLTTLTRLHWTPFIIILLVS